MTYSSSLLFLLIYSDIKRNNRDFSQKQLRWFCGLYPEQIYLVYDYYIHKTITLVMILVIYHHSDAKKVEKIENFRNNKSSHTVSTYDNCFLPIRKGVIRLIIMIHLLDSFNHSLEIIKTSLIHHYGHFWKQSNQSFLFQCKKYFFRRNFAFYKRLRMI